MTDDVTVSVDWLIDNLGAHDLVIVDGSWHLPPENRDPRREFEDAHIPGAVFFDLDKHSDQKSSLPHMMPSAEQFCADMGALGIGHTDHIIVYDSDGLFSAARVWWMFKQYGARKVQVLDGGLPAWKKAGYPLDSGVRNRTTAEFDASNAPPNIADLGDIKSAVMEEGGPTLLDARGPARFQGKEDEPRPGLQKGHMPGALNLPYRVLLDDEKKLKQGLALETAMREIGYEPGQPAIATCGSGVTAAIILLALARLGHHDVPLYDGSWSEWGSLGNVPIETG